jgi:hypothetical protein
VVQKPRNQHEYQYCTAWYRSDITVQPVRY